MLHQKTDQLLASMDEVLSSSPPVFCWRCLERRGNPSLCDVCHEQVDGYLLPPKGTVRVPWKEPDA